MRVSIKDFAKFYQSDLGKMVAELICEYTKACWIDKPQKDLSNEDILGYGFSPPIISRLEINSTRKINYVLQNEITEDALHLAENNWVIGEETRTPFQDGQFEKILCLSGLEESENPVRTLRELWRILSPEGSLILIVPNRRGVWARFDNSPFGQGRPFSRTQLLNLISESLFEVEIARRILYAPPINHSIINKTCMNFEKMGEALWPTFGGLLFFELKKRVLIEPPTEKGRLFKPIQVPNASLFSKQD
ncbi:MAG: methyltransferase domain-containing protein [Caulobacterales bacterium]|nr:methyltransferase domain-containing protein [Caulobacterales bacterium]MCA0371647.1 class I SAM-dependent methyltransferase [Pseudomonadota bacterium]